MPERHGGQCISAYADPHNLADEAERWGMPASRPPLR